MTNHSTTRFSDRVANYVKYRPGYPDAVLDHLRDQCNLNTRSIIADIGSGTGIFTKLLLDRGYTVNAVEPNEPMRFEAERQLDSYPRFHSTDGTAEKTNLPDHSADLVVCAQAFHWFNNEGTKAEFKRILKPEGQVALIWNNRDVAADNFAVAYDALLKQQSGDYERVNHQNLTKDDFVRFYRHGKYQFASFPNVQVFNLEQLTGRAFSSSYLPAEYSEAGKALSLLLRDLFNEHQTDGTVLFRYNTEVYLGEI